jgi:polyisoprenoid-binding protein YceI
MKIGQVMLYAGILTFYSTWTHAQDSWRVDSTRVVFHISNAGLDVEGSIAGVIGDIKFSKTKLVKSFFTATAKSETIQTGIKLRDKHLKKFDYFDVKNHPTINITSKQITKTKNGFDSICAITIKGQTKDINIPFTFKQTDNKGEFNGAFSLNRLDFGLGEKSIILSDTVAIEIWIVATIVRN